MPSLLMRAFVETDDVCVAEAIASQVRDALQAAGYSVTSKDVRQYWKIQGCFEILMGLVGGEVHLGVAKALLGSGWMDTHSGEAIWNAGSEAVFINELVRWAQLEVLE